jgi:hypothetical protein
VAALNEGLDLIGCSLGDLSLGFRDVQAQPWLDSKPPDDGNDPNQHCGGGDKSQEETGSDGLDTKSTRTVEHVGGEGDPNLLGGLEIQDELIEGRLFDRQTSRGNAREDLVDQRCGLLSLQKV